jgi:branched-chain amino acid transport system permease protein
MAANDVSPAPGLVPASAYRARALEFMAHRHRVHWAEALPWLVIVAIYFLLPDRTTFGTQVMIAIMFTLSLDLILGYAGIVTLGHAAFFGIGAYTVALLSARLHWGEPISALAAGALLAAAAGFVTGWFLLQYRGLTLLMLTLATAILVQEFGNYRSDITGGYDGVPGMDIWPLLGLFENDLFGRTYYVYVAVLLFVVVYALRRIVYSPFGQALTGIRENVRRMHAIGSPVHHRLVASYTLAAGIAGVAGALFAQSTAYATLGVFDFDNSAKVMVMLVLGGAGRLYGAFIGAPIYMILEDDLAKLSPAFWQFGIGLLLVVTVLFARRGLLGLIEDATRYFRGKQ